MTVFPWLADRGAAHPGSARLLIVDDSAVMRAIIAQMFEDNPAVEVAAMVASADQAFGWLSTNRADFILLDHEMPGQSGLAALPRLVDMAQGAHIIMLSSHCQRGSDVMMKALASGVSEAVLKPQRTGGISQLAEELSHLFRRLSLSRQPARIDSSPYKMKAIADDFQPQCIGIGASTGGIRILADLFAAVQGKPGIPVFITQHLPDAFIDGYAQHVGRMIDLPVSVASHGQIVEADHIYIAPGRASLCCRRHEDAVHIALVEERDPATLTRPSVNRMFSAMADCYGDGALGIILSGIGRDGTLGARRITDAGGAVLAQDRISSVVWGMPGAVVKAGLASAILPPAKLAPYVSMRSLCHV